ncbi:MAG: pilus assembly protein [Acidobacteria bacterium]|nr:pilus assembly protein [Acidobacteriota bacterium]
MASRRNNRRGSSMVEFALVFLPLMALLLGVFEMGRAMWTYHSVSAAVKDATRYSSVRGASCAAESSGCAPSVAEVTGRIRASSLGLEPSRFRLTLEAGSHTVSCDTMSQCLANSSYWPAWPNNSVGRTITVTGEYAFHTFLFSLWPGLNRTGFTMRSRSSEIIQF